MGSLTKAPKAPTRTVVVAAPTPIATPVSPNTPGLSTREQNANQREDNLLVRERGRFGTIATSFRGFLSQNEGASSRKTLLGE